MNLLRRGLVFVFTGLPACTLLSQNVALIDPQATPETKALYRHLKASSEVGFMFGHQEDMAYGVGWNAEAGRSDVKDVCGSFPAVHGWDLGKIELDRADNIDGVAFDKTKDWMREVYRRGGINTVSWHIDNPGTRKSAWDKTPATKDILPGGKNHDYFLAQLARAADFLGNCKDGNTFIPIIFRPWHEHNGDWFWWGKGNCTEEEYVALWKFTVTYFRDVKNLHHLIYAFSPDRSRMNLNDARSTYLYGYPGDDYVDLLGLDNYMDVGASWNKKSSADRRSDFISSLQQLSALAKEKNKVAALTETGVEGLVTPNWFTSVILQPIRENPNITMAFVLVWRNANTKHFYAPYPGHSSVADFLLFFNDPKTIFENDLPNVYK